MATHTQRLLWTALPAGLTEDGRRLRLSALLSPRLVVAPGPDDVLAAFPDLLGWPAVVRDADFEVQLAGTVAGADRVSEPDDAVHARLFPALTAVHSRVFEDHRATHVLDFPVAGVERDLDELYGRLAVEADGELPLLEDMRRRFGPLGRGLLADSPDEILEQIRDGERQPPDTPVRRLNLADLYHTPLAAPKTATYTRQGPDDPREDVAWKTHALAALPAPDSFRRSVDFHAIVSALAQYPALLRLTGLVVDLEVDRDRFPAGTTTGPFALRVRWTSRPETAAAGVSVEPDVAPQTVTLLDDQRFEALSRTPEDPPQRDGFLVLVRRGFDVVQVDVNGSALKVRQFAISMFQSPPGRSPADVPRTGQDGAAKPDPVAVPADRTGAPALRSGGLTLAHQRRGAELESRFAGSGAMEDALQAGTPILLHQEDLVRGYHVEIRDRVVSEWRSLCRRDTRFTFTADHAEISSEDNEGMLRLGASSSADGHNADLLKLYEGLFTWSGWSLTAPPVGRAVARDDSVTDAAIVAPDGLPLDVEHRVRSRSLPSLRYGHRYSLRLRVADLAGNARRFDPRHQSPTRTETKEIEYLRFEPVEAPTVALVGSGTTVQFPGPGEDLATAAIRSLNATPADNAVPSPETAGRHIVPPMSSQQQAEHHGMLDTGGRLDAGTYAMLVARDGALPEAAHPVTEKPFPSAGAGATLPFLPDPLAHDCVVRIAGRTAPDSVEIVDVPWFAAGTAWPDARLLRIEVSEPPSGGGPGAPVLDAATGVLAVPLAKADHVRVRISHRLADVDLRLLGIWRWASARLPADPATRSRLLELARTGQHWMLTPWRDIELVHAVQKPLVEPALEALAVHKTTGSTTAKLSFATPVDTRSTEKLDLFGRWLDPVDDPAEPRPRTKVGGGQRAAELKLTRLEAPGVDPPGRRAWTRRRPVDHEFGDTRYRRVGYRLTGTTRFSKFLPEPLQDPARADELTVTSAEAIGFVPNSAPPPAPDVVYVIPTFGWSRSGNESEDRSWRDGGGLRVYLRRPWLVSGYMEMLAAVLPRTGDRSADPSLSSFVTQWGADPTWSAGAVRRAAPPAASFALAVTAGPIAQARLDPVIPEREGDLPSEAFRLTGLPLPGVPGNATVDVAPHLVGWDAERGLWYADIVVDPGRAYAPFIRLALARYQPVSSPGSHLSPVATTEVVQLLPDRLAVLTRTSDLVYRVGLYGHAPQVRRKAVQFAVERLGADAGTDLGWEPLRGVTVGVPPATTAEPPPRPLQPRATPGGERTAPPVTAGTGEALAEEAQALLAARRFDEIVRRPDLVDLLRPPLIHEVEVRLPRVREEGERLRLVITESEVRDADEHHFDPPPPRESDPRRRVVYLETIELT